MKLKTGDKVKCINGYLGGWGGMTGTVVDLKKAADYSDDHIPIDFGKKSPKGEGHKLDGLIKTETGWWFPICRCDYYLQKVSVKQYEFSF